jgi:hypothetical protein
MLSALSSLVRDTGFGCCTMWHQAISGRKDTRSDEDPPQTAGKTPLHAADPPSSESRQQEAQAPELMPVRLLELGRQEEIGAAPLPPVSKQQRTKMQHLRTPNTTRAWVSGEPSHM